MGIDTTSPPLSSTPIYLVQLAFSPPFIIIEMFSKCKHFLELSEENRQPRPGHVQPGESAQTAEPQVGWEVRLGWLLSHTFTWGSAWLLFPTCKAHLGACVAEDSSRAAPSALFSLSPHHTASSTPSPALPPSRGFCFCHKIANTSTKQTVAKSSEGSGFGFANRQRCCYLPQESLLCHR